MERIMRLSILSYYTSRRWKAFSIASSSLGKVVLDSLAYDLLLSVLAESTIPTTTINTLEAGAVTCDGFGNNTGISITPAEATARASGGSDPHGHWHLEQQLD